MSRRDQNDFQFNAFTCGDLSAFESEFSVEISSASSLSEQRVALDWRWKDGNGRSWGRCGFQAINLQLKRALFPKKKFS